jgi:hypothetical protein
MPLAAADASLLSVAFGPGSQPDFNTGLRVLAGSPVENLFPAARAAGTSGQFSLFESAGWLLGAASVGLTPGLEAATHQLYLELFAAAHPRHLVRVWNYVPEINAPGPGGLENYRLFCRGRSLAFAHRYGADFKAVLPAASAVGTAHPKLTVVFAAAPRSPRHVENPRQVPAYEYPAEYGPRPPSFARATIVPGPDFSPVFISGTAAIRGHVTIAPDRTTEQVECTVENLHEISLACGLGTRKDGPTTRFFKVYLRDPDDKPAVAGILDQRLLQRGDAVTYLQADLCRASLRVEIEATVMRSPGGH